MRKILVKDFKQDLIVGRHYRIEGQKSKVCIFKGTTPKGLASFEVYSKNKFEKKLNIDLSKRSHPKIFHVIYSKELVKNVEKDLVARKEYCVEGHGDNPCIFYAYGYKKFAYFGQKDKNNRYRKYFSIEVTDSKCPVVYRVAHPKKK